MSKVAKILFVVALFSAVIAGCGSQQSSIQDNSQPGHSSGSSKEPAGDKQVSTYPDRPINLIIPYNAGGSTDVLSRALAKAMEKELGQPIVANNVVGAGGSLGSTEAARSNPDGHTLVVLTLSGIAISPHIQQGLSFTIDDFDYFGNFGEYHYGFMVRRDSPFNDFHDLVNHAKENPGKVTFGHTGLPGVIAAGMLKGESGAELTGVPFESAGENRAGMLGGHTDASIASPPGFEEGLKSGDIRLLAVIGGPRWEHLSPDTPTLKELGFDIDVTSAMGLAAPKGLPKDIYDIIMNAYKKALEDQEYLDMVKQLDLPVGELLYGDDFKEFVQERYDTFGKVIQDLGLAVK